MVHEVPGKNKTHQCGKKKSSKEKGCHVNLHWEEDKPSQKAVLEADHEEYHGTTAMPVVHRITCTLALDFLKNSCREESLGT